VTHDGALVGRVSHADGSSLDVVLHRGGGRLALTVSLPPELVYVVALVEEAVVLDVDAAELLSRRAGRSGRGGVQLGS
jgi:hypothetical protein